MKRSYRIIIFILPLLSLLGACGKEVLQPKDYVAWIENEDNGLRITRKMDDFTFRLQYKPAAYMALIQSRKNSAAVTSKSVAEFGELQYYNMSIRSANGEELLSAGINTENEYYERLQYYTGMVQDDIQLIQQGDTLPCVLAHFERNYGVSPENTIVLAFEQPADKNKLYADRTIIYNDRVLQTGPIRFFLRGSDINSIPEPQLK